MSEPTFKEGVEFLNWAKGAAIGKETIGDYVQYADFSRMPLKRVKKSWVPNWLWNLVSEIHIDDPAQTL